MVTEVAKNMYAKRVAIYLALGSFIMLFAGLTSAYIVKRAQAQWVQIPLPTSFIASTILIICSSIFLIILSRQVSKNIFKNYNVLLLLVLICAMLFVLTQYVAFKEMQTNNIFINGNVAGSFIYVFAIIHLLHVVGGIVPLVIFLFKSFVKKTPSTAMLNLFSIYWHFVDVLWIYLYLFLIFFR